MARKRKGALRLPKENTRTASCEAQGSVVETTVTKRRRVDDTQAFQSVRFRFLDLPRDVRFITYQLLLPHCLTLHFRPSHVLEEWYHVVSSANMDRSPTIPLDLFLVNKQICAEAQSLLFRENTFKFHISRQSIIYSLAHPVSDDLYKTKDARMRGAQPANTLLALHADTVKRLTKVHIVIQDEISRSENYRQVRRSMAATVARFGPNHNLNYLHIELHNGIWDFRTASFSRDWRELYFKRSGVTHDCRFQYCVEPLADLYGVANVEVTGQVASAFKAQLLKVLTSKDKIIIQHNETPTYQVMRKKPGSKKRSLVSVSSHRFHEPRLQWDTLNTNVESTSA